MVCPNLCFLVSGREFIFRLQVYSWVYALGQSNWTCMCVDFKGLPLLWIFYPGQFLKISLQTMLQIEFIFTIFNYLGFFFLSAMLVTSILRRIRWTVSFATDIDIAGIDFCFQFSKLISIFWNERHIMCSWIASSEQIWSCNCCQRKLFWKPIVR